MTKKVLHSKKIINRSSVISRKRTLLIAILVVLLTYSLVLLLVSVFAIGSPYRIEVLDYDFNVANAVGFNLDSDAIHFGSGPNTAVLNRGVVISASQDSIVKVLWDGPGDLAIDKNDFFMKSGSNTSISFVLTIPDDLPLGNYSGEVYFHFFNP